MHPEEVIIGNVKLHLVEKSIVEKYKDFPEASRRARTFLNRTYPLTIDGRILAQKPNVVEGVPTVVALVSFSPSLQEYIERGGKTSVEATILDEESEIGWPAGRVLEFDFESKGELVY